MIFLILSVFGTVFGADNTTELVSVDNSSIQGNQASADAVISADGRFVAFSSNADNLVAGDTNGYWDVFVRDRFLNITERVSISTSAKKEIIIVKNLQSVQTDVMWFLHHLPPIS